MNKQELISQYHKLMMKYDRVLVYRIDPIYPIDEQIVDCKELLQILDSLSSNNQHELIGLRLDIERFKTEKHYMYSFIKGCSDYYKKIMPLGS